MLSLVFVHLRVVQAQGANDHALPEDLRVQIDNGEVSRLALVKVEIFTNIYIYIYIYANAKAFGSQV
jgi:hypothetical protein